jgi:CubicO group peptidase (beta-lactamase class C family)
MTPDLTTNVASVSKIVTTIGALQSLASKGLTLDDPIAPYVYSDWTQGPNIGTITFKELLTHTAGIRPLLINGVQHCNDDSFSTAYADLKTVIATGVQPSNIGVAVYNNCNFALFRELLFAMAQGASQTSTDAQRATDSANFYINYINQNVFAPVGVTARMCSPAPAGTPDILSYPDPKSASTTKGNDWGDWTLLCGGAGWSLSANDLLDVIYYLVNGNLLLTDAEKIQMHAGCLGWDCSTGADCPHSYDCKNGALTNGSTGDAIRTYVGIFKCNVPVVVIANSPTSPGIIRLVNDAYRGAIVTNQAPAPCP